MSKEVNVEEFGKVRVYNKAPKKKLVPENERDHPVHTPYRRENRGVLRNSLVIDGLGDSDLELDGFEDDAYDDQD